MKRSKTMCNWRNVDNHEGAHGINSRSPGQSIRVIIEYFFLFLIYRYREAY